MNLFLLAVVSFVSWFISLLAGGGSPLLLIPIVSIFLGLDAVAPVVTIGLLIGHIQRVYLFGDEIDWPSTQWYLPGAITGAILGAYLLTLIHLEEIQLILGVVLVLMALYYWLGASFFSFQIKSWYFLPISFVNAIASSLIGSTGPVTNPLYLGYGLHKESFLATKSLHTSVLHFVKILAYLGLGACHRDYFFYGCIIGVASFPANWLGKIFLDRISQEGFATAVFFFMAMSGLWMVWQQRAWLMPV